MSIALRDANDQDDGFLFSLYCAIHEEQFKVLGWPEGALKSFMEIQFNARNASYSRDFPEAQQAIVLLDDQAVGALTVSRLPEAMRIVDIAVLPAYQNRGIGKTLLQDLIEESRRAALPLRLSVQKDNPGALRLYRKAGFREVKTADEDGLFLPLEYAEKPSE